MMKNSNPSLALFFLVMVVLFSSPAWAGVDRLVGPGQTYSTISAAMSASSSGDRIIVYDKVGGYTELVSITEGVQVLAAAGNNPIINEDSFSQNGVVQFANSSVTGICVMDGFQIKGGNTTSQNRVIWLRDKGILRNCQIVQTGSVAPELITVGSGAGEITNCTFTLSSGIAINAVPSSEAFIISGCTITNTGTAGTEYGIEWTETSNFTGGNFAEITGCNLIMGKGTGIWLRGNGSDTQVSGCDIKFTSSSTADIGILSEGTAYTNYGVNIRDNLITVPSGTGVKVQLTSGAAYHKVQFCTIDNVKYGVNDTNGGTVTNCIASNISGGGKAFTVAGSSTATYCITDQNNGYASGDQGTGSLDNENPLYRDPSNRDYGLRVDSYGNSLNNGSLKKIGAFLVTFMEGTLVRTSQTGAGSIDFIGDETIPSGKTLTLNPSTVIRASALSDHQSGGSDASRCELIVNGSFVCDEADMKSNDDTPGSDDWWGISISSTGTAHLMNNATIQDCKYGVSASHPHTPTIIEETTFSNISVVPLALGNIPVADSVNVVGNTIYVGAGSGIQMSSDCSGLHLDNNTISGNSSSDYGIFTNLMNSTATPRIQGNSFTGFSNGDAIRLTSGAAVINANTVSGCHYGIEILAGTHLIGTAGSNYSDNYITSCTNGVRCVGSSANPTVRENRIYSNTDGVVARSDAQPDLGNASQGGDNSIYSNSSHCVVNTSLGTGVTAIGNWWGSCNQPSCTSGIVVTVDWLCSQPTAEFVEIGPNAPTPGLRITRVSPNPAREGAAIGYSLGSDEQAVSYELFDIAGRLILKGAEPGQSAGEGMLALSFRGPDGKLLQSGVYLLRLVGSSGSETTAKLVVAR